MPVRTKKSAKKKSAKKKATPRKNPARKKSVNVVKSQKKAVKKPVILPEDAPSIVQFLDKSWPGKKTAEVRKLFNSLKSQIKSAAERSDPPESEQTPPTAPTREPVQKTQSSSFSMMDLLRRTLAAHDLLFLRRQVTYHIAASANMPNVFADGDRIQAATASLLEYMAVHAPRGSRISVQLKEIPLRSGNGIEISFIGTDTSLQSVDKTTFLHRMYEADTEDGQVLINCRELVSSQGGQMWADLPEPKQPTYRMILPTFEGAKESDKPNKMYKYDISISNYANVRKRFGIRKSLVLVGQIEMYVRALVRHPIDIVTAVREKGVITTIYESPKGGAQSVASRISQRLGSEEFRIGKKVVDLLFRYELSQLPSSNGRKAPDTKEMPTQ